MIRGLFDQLGGEVGDGGPIKAVIRAQMEHQIHLDHERFDNFIVDEYDRALAVMIEFKEGRRLRIVVAVYDEPRCSYLRQSDPLLERLPHSNLN